MGKLVNEGLTLFIRKRLSKDEFDLKGELKHGLANIPAIRRRVQRQTPA